MYKNNKATFRLLLAGVFVIVAFASCGGKNIRDIVYEEPVNGSKVFVLLERSSKDEQTAQAVIVCLGNSTFGFVKQKVFVGEFMDLIGDGKKEMVSWPHYYDESKGPHLDWRTIVAFDDYDFDGEKELVVCGYPRPHRDDVDGHWLDCEDFTFYKHTREGYVKIDNKPFDALASGLCRTHYDFDTCNHTLTLIGVESAFESDTTVYYFRDGKVYEDTIE